jgi:hypothetical protein
MLAGLKLIFSFKFFHHLHTCKESGACIVPNMPESFKIRVWPKQAANAVTSFEDLRLLVQT